MTCVTGGSWAQAQLDAQRMDPKARPYRSGDLAFVATTELVSTKSQPKGAILAKPRTRMGYSLSTTGWKELRAALP